ncbi:MAG: Hpt domain-containing protein [Planctomycetota bacterium]|jgi:HPt (histidine-containing phosphotransfer) domain-containing protein|nr:Hpt domain-containing protein [Planctomycetota bacterium]
MSPPPDQHHGLQIARLRFPDDPEMAALAEMFLQQLEVRIQELREACRRGDLDTVRFGTHQLRGAAGGYGFPEIGKAAGEIEDLLRIRATDTEDSMGEMEISRGLESLESLFRSIAAA